MQTTLQEQNSQATQTKKCPFCAELIQAEAIKCRYCGEFFCNVPTRITRETPDSAAQPRTKWYYSGSTLLFALCCLGPLALPLVWFNPRYGKFTKILITGAVVVLTILLCQFTVNTYKNLMDQIKALGLN